MDREITLTKTKQWHTLKQLRYRFIREFLDLMILARLRSVTYVSGYDVINHIHQKFNILLSSGTTYSTLYSMERKGLIKGEWKGGRRIYSISPKGEEFIQSVITNRDFIMNLAASLLYQNQIHSSTSESELG